MISSIQLLEYSNSSIWRNFAPCFQRRNKTDTTATQAKDDFTKISIFVSTMSFIIDCTNIWISEVPIQNEYSFHESSLFSSRFLGWWWTSINVFVYIYFSDFGLYITSLRLDKPKNSISFTSALSDAFAILKTDICVNIFRCSPSFIHSKIAEIWTLNFICDLGSNFDHLIVGRVRSKSNECARQSKTKTNQFRSAKDYQRPKKRSYESM